MTPYLLNRDRFGGFFALNLLLAVLEVRLKNDGGTQLRHVARDARRGWLAPFATTRRVTYCQPAARRARGGTEDRRHVAWRASRMIGSLRNGE